MKYFYYLTPEEFVVRVKSKRKPSKWYVRKKSFTWVIEELFDNEWTKPVFPEVTLNTLSQLEYIGSTKAT